MSNENRSRKNQIHLFLSDEEYNKLLTMQDKSGLTVSELIRQLINGCTICEAPPVDFWELTKQIRYYGNNLNQISKRMNLFGLPDVEAYQRNTDKVFSILDNLQKVMLTRNK